LRVSPPFARNQSHDEHEQKQHEKNGKQNLGDFHGACGDAGETEYSGDQRDDEKYGGVVEHVFILLLTGVDGSLSLGPIRPPSRDDIVSDWTLTGVAAKNHLFSPSAQYLSIHGTGLYVTAH